MCLGIVDLGRVDTLCSSSEWVGRSGSGKTKAKMKMIVNGHVTLGTVGGCKRLFSFCTLTKKLIQIHFKGLFPFVSD